MRARITIRDVAEKAGVSVSTVSRVLSPQVNDYMRKETRGKVLKAIKELDYRPDIRAQSLRGRGTRIVGLVMPDAEPILPGISLCTGGGLLQGKVWTACL